MSMAVEGVLFCEVLASQNAKRDDSRPLTTLSDIELVSRARTDDLSAFEELVRRYRNDVFALSYHFVRNREEAWDMSQEVFIKAHRALKHFRGEASFKTWLLRITANQCKDFLKKRRISAVHFDEAIETREAAPGPQMNPARRAEAEELGRAILEALESLPAKHRTAFVLREFEGLSYDEMARVMGCNLGTVMSRLHHARKKLQHRLVQMGMAEDVRHG